MKSNKSPVYCAYCGRVAHRCDCATPDSRLQRFRARNPAAAAYPPRWLPTPYKRGVPPQVKRRERAVLQANYAAWYAQLVAHDGVQCLNCGATIDLVIDHVIPVAKGGISQPENLQLLCKTCNNLKGKLAVDCRE